MATGVSSLRGRGGHLVFFLVLAGHALLLSSQVTNERGDSLLRRAILGVLAPLQRAGDATVDGVRGLWYGYVDLRTVYEENRRLRERVARLEQALWLDREVVAGYDRLRRALELAERMPFDATVAEVIGVDATAWFRTVTIDRGREDGIRLNAPVLAPGGLVGRVIAVAPRVAQVQLVSDREAAVGAMLARTRARGVVAGAGRLELDLKYVSNLEDVVSGDLVVTSGIDGIYPKGIAVGRVVEVQNGPRLFKIIRLEPAARLDRLEEVFVLEPVRREETFVESVDPERAAATDAPER